VVGINLDCAHVSINSQEREKKLCLVGHDPMNRSRELRCRLLYYVESLPTRTMRVLRALSHLSIITIHEAPKMRNQYSWCYLLQIISFLLTD
jgi:hypothetical protein